MLTEAQIQIIEMTKGNIRHLHELANLVDMLSSKHSEEEIPAKLSEMFKTDKVQAKIMYEGAKTYLKHF